MEEYSVEPFKPEEIAHTLLLSTLTKQDRNVDVSTALTRLKYDRLAVAKRVETLCKQNSSLLLAYAAETESAQLQLRQLQPSLANVSLTSRKLEHDFVDPVKRANSLLQAATALHTTAELARQLLQYLQLALQVQSVEYTRESRKNEGVAGMLMLRNATALKQLQDLVLRAPKLVEISVVSDFELQVPQFRQKLVETATSLVSTFTGASSSQIRLAVLTLQLLGVDTKELVLQRVAALVAASTAQLSRLAGSSASANTLAPNSASAVTALVAEHRYTLQDLQKRASACTDLVSIYNQALNADLSVDYAEKLGSALAAKFKTMRVANMQALTALKPCKRGLLDVFSAWPQIADVYATAL